MVRSRIKMEYDYMTQRPRNASFTLGHLREGLSSKMKAHGNCQHKITAIAAFSESRCQEQGQQVS